MTRVAVIGGGYAGFAAATELSHAGIPVTLFEAARVPGGRARRVKIHDLSLDNGLHVLIGAYRETLRLIDKVSLPTDPTPLRRIPLRIDVAGRLRLRAPQLPAPFHLGVALLTARGISLGDRLKIVSFMLALRRQRYRIAPDMTVDELLVRHGQSEFLCRYLWRPLCISALNTLASNASAQVFVHVLRDSLLGSRADSDFLLPVVDFSALFPERAARYIREQGGSVLVAHRVETVRRVGPLFTVRAANTVQYFTHVVMAVSPHHLPALCTHLPRLSDTLQCVNAFEYRPIHSVYLQYAPSTRLPTAMIGLDAELSQWVFDRGQLTSQPGLLGVVISADGPHQSLTHDELAALVHAELAQTFAGLGSPLWWQVIGEKRATFACTVNLRRPEMRTAIPRLFLAGDYVAGDYPATLEAAVRSGVECARLVQRSL
jgi:squalene-associated FAD-dependent desaturase